MNFLKDIYVKSIAENDKNIRFWEDYLNSLKALDFNIFSEKLKVPALVPIGSKIFFRGELKHTNEVTIALGADYFVKCSLKQAEVLKQHRIKGAESKLDDLRKERDYLENHLSFTHKSVFEDPGQEIVEYYTENEDKAWREKHREKIREYKQNTRHERNLKNDSEVKTDKELWDRLEELELQEELDAELLKNETPEIDEKHVKIDFQTGYKENTHGDRVDKSIKEELNIAEIESSNYNKVEIIDHREIPSSKLHLLQQAIDRQNELEEKLNELKNRERYRVKSERDLFDKLDEIEQLEACEDEMDRLDDIIEIENVSSDDENSNSSHSKHQKSVLFADEDDSETVEITFKHSIQEPSKEPYKPEMGIQKPSDVYEAYSKYFKETTSILKKTKYEDKESNIEIPKVVKTAAYFETETNVEELINETIEINDVVEKKENQDKSLDHTGTRPMSLFKQKRQQMKSKAK